jgi:hypothetical protein
MLTGVLTSAGLNIAGARIATSQEGIAPDVFQLSHVDRKDVVMDTDTWTHIYSRRLRFSAASGRSTTCYVSPVRRRSSLVNSRVMEQMSPSIMKFLPITRSLISPAQTVWDFTVTYALFALIWKFTWQRLPQMSIMSSTYSISLMTWF